MELQILLELSQRKTKDLVSALRKGMVSRIAVEEGVFEKLSKIEDSIATFYDVQEVIFKSTGGLDLKVISTQPLFNLEEKEFLNLKF